jgi:hypothetical protein
VHEMQITSRSFPLLILLMEIRCDENPYRFSEHFKIGMRTGDVDTTW